MTAWIVGQWMAVHVLHEDVRLSAASGTDGLRQWLSYELRFGASRLKATVSLDRGAASLSWAVECDWLEVGRPGHGVPQLNFFLPSPVELKSYRFDVPFGTIDRPAAEIDRPANSWVIGVPRKIRPKVPPADRRPGPWIPMHRKRRFALADPQLYRSGSAPRAGRPSIRFFRVAGRLRGRDQPGGQPAGSGRIPSSSFRERRTRARSP